jgi:hypothetical protein
MGYALGYLKFVSCITHRPLHSAGLATRVTPVRGREIYKMGHAPGVCDRCQDLITYAMSPLAWLLAMQCASQPQRCAEARGR